jgi:hypothetical protein
MARLRKDLFKATFEDDGDGMKFIKVRIVLQPYKYVTIQGRVVHGKLHEYELGDLGEIILFPDHFNLVWRFEDKREVAERTYDFDTNMRSLDGVSDDGKVVHIDTSEIVRMQDAERRKRKHL